MGATVGAVRATADSSARDSVGTDTARTDSVPADPALPRRAQGLSGRVRVGILMLNPPLLHLTPAQHRQVNAVQAGMDCRTSQTRAVIAMGRRGGLWVERILDK
jgi:hypothetical protein